MFKNYLDPSKKQAKQQKETNLKYNRLMFKLLEVPEPANVGEMEAKTAFKKALLQKKENMQKLAKDMGVNHFRDYVLVIFKILQESGIKASIFSKEFTSVIRSFDEIGMSEALGIFDKVQVTAGIQAAFKDGTLEKIDVKAYLELMNENAKKYGLIGNPGKILIYNATTAARSDGEYSLEEKAAIKKLGQEIGISDDDFDKLQKLIRIHAKFNGVDVSRMNLNSKEADEPTAEEELDTLYNEVFAEPNLNNNNTEVAAFRLS